jgi:hypothetical protein
MSTLVVSTQQYDIPQAKVGLAEEKKSLHTFAPLIPIARPGMSVLTDTACRRSPDTST